MMNVEGMSVEGRRLHLGEGETFMKNPEAQRGMASAGFKPYNPPANTL